MTIGPNFWSTQNQAPPQPVLEANTVGDQQQNPTNHIPGAAGGAVPTAYTTAARAVYPVYDGNVNKLPGLPTDLSTFSTWHSAHQLEYLRDNGGVHTISQSGNPVAEFRILNGKPVNIMNLALSDLAMLPAADQTAIAGRLQDLGIAQRLGLTSNKTDANNAIAAAHNELTGKRGAMNDADLAIFSGQLDILSRKVAGTALVATDKIASEVKAILDRFYRAAKFVNVSAAENLSRIEFYRDENPAEHRFRGAIYGVQAQVRAVSSDSGATIGQGYAEFMRAEREILTMKTRREALSATAAIKDPKLDVANLIYQLQLLYEAEAGGIADAGTEEIRQLHKLLQDYGVMQRLVNETIKAYDPKKPEEKRRFMNMGGREDGGIEGEQRNDTLSGYDMAITFVWPGGSVRSPGGKGEGNGGGSPRYQNTAGYHWFHLQGSGLSDAWTYVASGAAVEVRDPSHAWYKRPIEYFSRIGHNNAGKTNGGLSAEEMRIFSMFSNDHWAAINRAGHPMESLYDVTRPTQKFTGEHEDADGSLELHRKTVWDSFSTQLNDAVTLLNQRNQIKQNEIENASRRQNRHFDLGNNALRKMNDMLMTIGRI